MTERDLLIEEILDVNFEIKNILTQSSFQKTKELLQNYLTNKTDPENKSIKTLTFENMAAIRLLDYIKYDGLKICDFNLSDKELISNPLSNLWSEVNNISKDVNKDFLEDFLYLFKQLDGNNLGKTPTKLEIRKYMDRYSSGLEEKIQLKREVNKKRILKVLIKNLEKGIIKSNNFKFTNERTFKEKMETASSWWKDYKFHLSFSIKDPDLLNEALGNSLSSETMNILYRAKNKRMPFFVNPYYLSLLDIENNDYLDSTIRDYILYNNDLVNNFGEIRSWEKEDKVEIGKPNAAGWILPAHSIHRRYPEVVILIPRTAGRACGGLCSSCQRFYGFQNGILQFDLDSLNPSSSWKNELQNVMNYFQNDSQLRDIIITGGDALMNSNQSLENILNSVYDMAKKKKEDNLKRPHGEKFSEMVRVRLGTRLPVNLPQRVTAELISILKNFKEKASAIGLSQFVIQTHFISSYEITPESQQAVAALLSTGWMVTNQDVFTSSCSRRGHTAKLREDLNKIGVLPYYTFSVKGGFENRHMFATNSRLAQEKYEEKTFGKIPALFKNRITDFHHSSTNMISNIQKLKKDAELDFLSTDRSVLNIPGVEKSLTFRVVGLTNDGRRVLHFSHDHTRTHSPIIEQMEDIFFVESRSIRSYLNQLISIGENEKEYETLWYYSLSETENREPIFEYPDYNYSQTKKMTNLKI